MLPLWFALAVFVGRNYAHSDDGPTLVGSHDELKAAIANASIPEIDVVANPNAVVDKRAVMVVPEHTVATV